jgi:hypothetical protein
MKRLIKGFQQFLNESSEIGRGRHTYSRKEVSFSQWLEDLLAQWPFIRKDFEEAGIDPYSLTDDNFYDMVKSVGHLYNKDRNLYRIGKYISVERNENWKGKFVTSMAASADISTYGRWFSNGEGTVVGNPHPNIDTGREGT